jgi:hypothetical protein
MGATYAVVTVQVQWSQFFLFFFAVVVGVDSRFFWSPLAMLS